MFNTALQNEQLRIRQNVAADRKAAARQALRAMETRPDAFEVNDWIPGVMIVRQAHPIKKMRSPLPLSALTVEAARGMLRHERSVGDWSLASQGRQALALAAVVFALRARAAVAMREAA